MRSSAFERGARAARKGKALKSNPFAKREGKANARRAAEWADGWNSTEFQAPVPSNWSWPPLQPIVRAQAGDYCRRERGLEKMLRPPDLVEYDVLRAEMHLGLVHYVPTWAAVPVALLAAFSAHRGNPIDVEPAEPDPHQGHPLKFLWTALQIQKSIPNWPPLVVSAYEELNGTVFETLRPVDGPEDDEADSGDSEGE